MYDAVIKKPVIQHIAGTQQSKDTLIIFRLNDCWHPINSKNVASTAIARAASESEVMVAHHSIRLVSPLVALHNIMFKE